LRIGADQMFGIGPEGTGAESSSVVARSIVLYSWEIRR
jgi:hypothetical protein